MVIFSILLLLAALGLVLWQRRRQRKILSSLNDMLDKAMNGDFTEEDFDESLLSSVESRLAKYLAASTVSARNLRKEKDSIKTLIADISHQTKTPIANILLYTQLLQEQTLPEESRFCVTALEGQAEKLQTLIQALVKTSRLESGIIALHPADGELSEAVQSAVAQLMPKAKQKRMEVQTGGSGTALFDPKWTEEAVFNLLENAVKYTPEGGSIRVEVKEYAMFSAIEVTDNGPGIPEEEQPKIFQRFYRGMEHSQQEGVGIGLYLVRQIAEGQGGYVKVSSKPGAGSTFAMYLPKGR